MQKQGLPLQALYFAYFTGVIQTDSFTTQVATAANGSGHEIDGLVALLGSTLDTSNLNAVGQTFDASIGLAEGDGADYTYGFIIDSSSGTRQYVSLLQDLDRFEQATDDFTQIYYNSFGKDDAGFSFGSYLVQRVPEPPTFALVLLALMGVKRFKRQGEN